MQTVPNDGLIRYFDLLNSERVLIISPEGLTEFRHTKLYHFVKSPGVRKVLVRLLGEGLIVAEGAEHKESSPNRNR